MQKFHSVSKRTLAMLLTLAMMVPMFASLFTFGVAAVDEEENYATRIDGEVVAENYDLTEAEKRLLESGYLIGATKDYFVPDASDDLISVNIDNKTIKMKSITGDDGTVCNPVSVEIVVNNQVIETIDNLTGNQVSYATDSTAFAVKVKYEGKNSVDANTQSVLLNASAILKGGIDNLEAILNPQGDIQKALDTFAQFSMTQLPADELNANPEGKPIFQLLLEDGYKFPLWGTAVTAQFKDAEGAAATELWNQLSANGGKLNLAVIADEYAAAESKVKFLIDNAERIMLEAGAVRGYMGVLCANGGTLSIIANNAPDGIMKDGLANYLAAMVSLAGDGNNAGYLAPYATVDAWKILTTNPVKADLNDLQYATLDVYVEQLGSDIKGASAVVVNPVTVATTTIQFNMSMYDVKVQVALNVVEANQIVRHDMKELTLTFAENATEEEILDAIADSGIEDEALNAWAGVFVDGQFNRAVNTQLSGNITSDVDYTITYSPKYYDVNYLGEAASYPYGYQIILPVHESTVQAYDYKVNGVYYAQGSIVKITENTEITRSEGKAYTSYPVIDKLVVENFFKGNDEGTLKAIAILTSGAINTVWSDVTVDVRLPDSDGLVSLVGNKLTASTYASSYKGLYWVPYTYTVGANVHYFDGATEVNVLEPEYDSIQVEYRLVFSDITGIQGLLDIPGILAGEADSQIAALGALNAYYSQMGEIGANKFALTVLATAVKTEGDANDDGVFEDADMEALYNAINGFTNNCFEGNSLKIYNLLTGYREGGLAYYYKNSEKFANEIDVLNSYLVVIGQYKAQLKNIVASSLSGMLDADQLETVNKAIDKIDELRVAVENLKRDLKAPNALIDLDSDNLEILTRALESKGTVPAVTEKPMYLSTFFVQLPDGKVSLNVKVQDVTVIVPSFTKGHILTADDVQNIINAVEAKMAELNYPSEYYNCNYSRDVFTALIGKDIADLSNEVYEFTYTLEKFEVVIEGVGTTTVDLNHLTISLPKSNDPAYRYDYYVFGNVTNVERYTFTKAEFDKIVQAGSYTIARKVVDVELEAYKSLINNLNKAVGSNMIVFALTENGGQYSVVMKIDASAPNALQGALMGMVSELMKHDYVAFENNAMIYTTDNGMKISLQAIVDTVLDSGFSSDKFLGMMNSRGGINNMKMPGKVVSDKAMAEAGALLVESELCLGKNANDLDYQLPLYITVGAVSSEFVSVRNLFADRLSGYFAFECIDGEVSLGITLPKKAYEAYLAALLATETVDFNNINDLNEKVAFGFMQDLITPLLKTNASAKTIQNTLAKFGYNINLAGYESAFELVREIYLNSTFVYDDVDSTYDTTLNVSIDSYLDKMNLGIIGDMIAEKGVGINIPVSASLNNLDKDYEAMYFDLGAAGTLNKVGFAEDISAKLGTMSGTSVVVLLKDIKDSLNFKTTTILNLNGFTVNGNISGNVTITDNNMTGGNGGATGTVSGNVVVAGGKFNSDVSAFLPSGYKQGTDGVVAHKYLTITKDRSENVTIKVDAAVVKPGSGFDKKTLIVDVVAELLLNEFTTNKCYINGIRVFEVTVDDVVAVYTAADRNAAIVELIKTFGDTASLNQILNLLIDDATNFKAIQSVLNRDLANNTESPVFSYNLTTGTWDVEFKYVEESNSIDLDVLTKNENNSKLNLVITGTKADKQYLAGMVDVLADNVDAEFDANVSLKSGTTVGVEINGKVDADFSADNDYAVLLSTIIADSLGANANASLVAGLKVYFLNGDLTDLKAAFNDVKISQILKAVKNFNNNKTFYSMLSGLGLAQYYDSQTATLEAKLYNTVYVVTRVLGQVNFGGSAAKIGNFYNAATDTYVFEQKDINKTVSASGVNVNVEIESLYVTVKFFGKSTSPETPPTPPIIDPPNPPKPPVVDEIDYSKLEKEIEKIEAENLVESKYTESSWSNLQSALDIARALVENKNATTQTQVTNALIALVRAREALAEKVETPVVEDPVDYTELVDKIHKAEGFNKDDYTEESWQKLLEALEAAREALNSDNQAEVNSTVAALNSAINGLKKQEEAPKKDNSWIWIVVIVVVVLGAAGGAAYVVIRKKKNLVDTTPLVEVAMDAQAPEAEQASEAEQAPEAEQTPEAEQAPEAEGDSQAEENSEE